MNWSIAGIIAVITGLFYWWLEGMITSPLEDMAVQSANSTAQYGMWWFGPVLGLTFFGVGVLSLLAIFNQ